MGHTRTHSGNNVSLCTRRVTHVYITRPLVTLTNQFYTITILIIIPLLARFNSHTSLLCDGERARVLSYLPVNHYVSLVILVILRRFTVL
ncbi:hypothetical protein GGS21DRAFT_520631 [Xylaria nigripes]|nr:hypothetical protein GGS21DRAFT_520631 [Xylaria nigripes]